MKVINRKIKKIKISEYYFKSDLNKSFVFAFVSDLHNCDNSHFRNELFSVNPDAVLIGGDYLHDYNVYNRGLEFLTESADLFPTFCCVGNHERKYRGNLKELILPTGAVLLDDEFIDFNNLYIGGLSSGYLSARQNNLKRTPSPNLKFLKDFSEINGFKILLCHHPEYYDLYLKNLDIDVIISGHAHGGQWRAFGKGVFAPGQGFFPKYTSGLYNDNFIVSTGIGDPYIQPRVNNPSEIVLININ